MSEQHAADADALGAAAFKMVIALLHTLKKKDLITFHEGLKIISDTAQPPLIPGSTTGLTDKATSMVVGQVQHWNAVFGPPAR